MEVDQLLDRLGYADSPHFLRAGTASFEKAPDHGHIFRHAREDLPRRLDGRCEIVGVYSLSAEAVSDLNSQVPLVYVCRADSSDVAHEVHRLVWNQDVVPFILIHTPRGLILHSGFWYERRPGQAAPHGILRHLTAFNAIQDIVGDFHARAIDSGLIWKGWRSKVTPEKRVDWKLLDNLRKLDSRLQNSDLDRDVAHALIGKYVFLHYLRDRGILSPRKLEKWGLSPNDVFGRTATLDGLRACDEELEAWLNGGVFPVPWNGRRAPSLQHIQAVASTFAGAEPQGTQWWQLAFDFGAYDFSFIPIETLSVIYEQFLHAPRPDGRRQGKERGAYYTPIPLVNLMLTQLEDRKRIQRGVRILDPACGSGAFLVQAYRRLIEHEFSPIGKRPTPTRLRRLMHGVVTSMYPMTRQRTRVDERESAGRESMSAFAQANGLASDFGSRQSDSMRPTRSPITLGPPVWGVFYRATRSSFRTA